MTFGRPCCIGPKASKTVPLPVPVDEEYLAAGTLETQVGRAKRTHATEFYVLSLQLFEIMHDILFDHYSVNCMPSEPGDTSFGFLNQGENSLFDLERRLSRWASSVPDHLRPTDANKPRSGTAEATLYRQAVVLRQRQLHVRLLLLRPVLSNFITSEFRDGDRVVPLDSLLSQRVHLECAITCVKVALEAVDTIQKETSNAGCGTALCAAWWYNVLYLYTSATVLIAARLAPAIIAEVSEVAILKGWNTAVEILEGYSAMDTSIKRLTTTLRLLLEAVPQQFSRIKDNSWQAQQCASSQTRVQHPPESFDTPPRSWSRGLEADFALTDDAFLNFDMAFDPKDLSWLMTVPFDT